MYSSCIESGKLETISSSLFVLGDSEISSSEPLELVSRLGAFKLAVDFL